MRSIHFSSTTTLEPDGVNRIDLEGPFTSVALAKELTDRWVPLQECHQCGRFDYCKFAQRDPKNPLLSPRSQCGVYVLVLERFVAHTFDLLERMTATEHQHYLDAAFHLGQFIYRSEILIGHLMDEDVIAWFGDLKGMLFGHAVGLRESLDRMAIAMRTLPAFHATRGILTLEGESEELFLLRMQQSGVQSFAHRKRHVYGGRGNLGKRTEMLLEDWRKDGYKVYLQYDRDGKKQNAVVERFVAKGLISKERSFGFRYDFESSVPLDLVLEVLQSLGHLVAINRDSFVERLAGLEGSLAGRLSSAYGLDLEPLKTRFASALGGILSNPRHDWWRDESFSQCELGRFLRFVQRAH